MNPRSPLTPGGAFARVKDILSAKVCAQFLGVSEWTIYDRCDVQELGRLNLTLAQSFELDAMCQEKTGEKPLCNLYCEKLDGRSRAAGTESLHTAGVELARDVGDVEAVILSTGEERKPLSNRQLIELQTSIQKAKVCLSDMEVVATRARQP